MSRIVDLTHEQRDPPTVKKKHKLDTNGKVVKRDPSTIDGIVIHQTACVFGATKQAVIDAGGDAVLAKHRRALGVACHVCAFNTGYAVYANPLTWYLHHGNKFNTRSLGLEIEGRYPGLLANPIGTTWGGKPTPLTTDTIEAAKAALEFLVTTAKAQDMPIKYIWAHRQSSNTRQSDPGEELWKKLVLGYAVPVLGLSTEPAKVVGDGRPIPITWDPAGVGKY